jgi:hypothetical protein
MVGATAPLAVAGLYTSEQAVLSDADAPANTATEDEL